MVHLEGRYCPESAFNKVPMDSPIVGWPASILSATKPNTWFRHLLSTYCMLNIAENIHIQTHRYTLTFLL